jgi:cysteine desulfurase / selenocysteine lyase
MSIMDAMTRHTYLDNAATSFPKPETVYSAMDDYNRRLGAAVGRGAYGASLEVTRIVERCRKRIAELLNAESPERVVFTFNATDALNLALHGLLRPGDHVVTSMIEHNSVLRPLRELQVRGGVSATYVGCDRHGVVDPGEIRKSLRPETKLIALVHASNVTGAIQPVEEVGRIAREAGVLFLLDAAQTAGHLPLDAQQLGADFVAAAGHKGLLGPLGTGLLYLRPGVDEQIVSLRQGGTGTRSEDDLQPSSLPDKYESGNHNAPGLIGLEAATAWIQEQGILALRAHEQTLTGKLLDGLSSIAGVQTIGPPEAGARVGVVSVTIDGYEPQDAAAILDENFGIEVRAGLHCAPGVHRALGTFDRGGTVRFSVGPFNTPEQIDAAIESVRQIAGG